MKIGRFYDAIYISEQNLGARTVKKVAHRFRDSMSLPTLASEFTHREAQLFFTMLYNCSNLAIISPVSCQISQNKSGYLD